MSIFSYTFGDACGDLVSGFLDWSSRKTGIEDKLIAGWIMFLLLLWVVLFVAYILLWWGFKVNMNQLNHMVNSVIGEGKILYLDKIGVR